PSWLSVGRKPMLLKPLSMMLPSRLRTGPFGAMPTRRADASVSSFSSWQFEQRTWSGLRVRSLNKCAPNNASRLIGLGSTLVQGFNAGSGGDVASGGDGCARRNWSHGVLSETSVASYICTARPKNSAKLYWISEYSLPTQFLTSHSPLFFAT